MYAWIVKNKTRILILYCLKVLIFIPQVATATGEACFYDGNANATVWEHGVWNGLQTFNRQTAGTQVQQAGTWHLYKIFDLDPYTNPTTIYATSTDALYDNGTSSLAISTIFTNHGAGTYIAIGNSGFMGLCGDSLHGNGYSYFSIDGSGNVTFLELPNAGNLCADATTRILDFSPQDNASTTNPVTFDLSACINPADIGTIKGINIRLHNYDQNVLLIGSLSPSDFEVLFDRNVQTSGLYQFSTSTTIGEGNYRIEACIDRSYLYGFIENPFSSVSTCESHQFVVGSSTYIGNISQRIFGETNTFLNGLSATSSEALASTCNPLGGNFGIRECTAFLFIPDGASMQAIVTDLKSGILTRPPIGYFTRFISILSNPATTTIPTWTASIQVGAGNNPTPEITTITIDPADMLAGGASLLDSIHDPITNKTARDVFYPMVQLTIALSVIMTIVADIAGSHRESERNKNV